MIELLEKDLYEIEHKSSKGNQLKWEKGNVWYKADYTGYEGLAEYMVSHLLQKSTLKEEEYLLYKPETIKYKRAIYSGVSSINFVDDGWQIITLERIFKTKYNQSFYEAVWHIHDVKERFNFICKQVEILTGLKEFDKYFNILLTVDALFLNEDRHLHNIAVMMNSKKEFRYCPIFDNGACLLSDTTIDYPLSADTIELLSECKAKTISDDFDEQLDVSEEVARQNISFFFTKCDVEQLLDSTDIYSSEIKERVKTIIFQQMRKYGYLFT